MVDAYNFVIDCALQSASVTQLALVYCVRRRSAIAVRKEKERLHLLASIK